jgi:hypothetical protein
MRDGRAHGLLVAVVLALGCGDADVAAPRIPVVGRDGEAMSPVRFVDGATVHGVVLPDPIDPDAPVRVQLVDEGPAGEWTIELWPPRVGGRELVLGSGVTVEDAARPDDARVVSVTVPSGTAEVELGVPSPWHPTMAMVTVARTVGSSRVAAVDGPRTRDGLGVLALARVDARPTHVQAHRAAEAPAIDGAIEDSAWSSADWIEIGDSLGGEPQRPRTRVAFAWDDDALFVAADLADDDVWSSFADQDDPLWKEEAFELFLLGAADRTRYLELQVSPRGVTFDAKFERYRKGDEAWDGTWTGAAAVQGTVDARDDRDRRWSVEIAVPWAEICAHTQTSCPPQVGATTRVNAFRLDRPKKGAALAWALSPTREPDFHAQENAAVLELVQ